MYPLLHGSANRHPPITLTCTGFHTHATRLNPYPYPRKPNPSSRVWVFDRLGTGCSQKTQGLPGPITNHPQTDGQSERTNQGLEIFVRCYCDEEQDNWHIWLPMAEFTHNQWPNATTRETPFKLIMGYTPKVEWIKKPSPVPQVEEQLKELEQVRKWHGTQ
jgi:hypothetical protein